MGLLKAIYQKIIYTHSVMVILATVMLILLVFFCCWIVHVVLTFLFAGSGSFIKLCYHHKDFGVDAEWHFSATSHGKGACDGVGGTV